MPKEKSSSTEKYRIYSKSRDDVLKRRAKMMRSCRLCTKNPGIQSMYDYVSEDPADDPLPKKLKVVTGTIQMYKGDGLPEKICSECLLQLNSVYAFVLQMVNTQKRLDRQTKGKNCTPGAR